MTIVVYMSQSTVGFKPQAHTSPPKMLFKMQCSRQALMASRLGKVIFSFQIYCSL